MAKFPMKSKKLPMEPDGDEQMAQGLRVPGVGMPPMGPTGPTSPLRAAVLGPRGPQMPSVKPQMPKLPRPRGIKGTTDFKSLMGALKQRG